MKSLCFLLNFGKYRRAVRLNRLRVTIGEYDLAKAELPLDSIDVRIEKLTIHPRFNIYGYINDIALIKVERPMEWTPYVWPACLSSKNFEPEGRNGTVAGWGSMTDTNRGLFRPYFVFIIRFPHINFSFYSVENQF